MTPTAFPSTPDDDELERIVFECLESDDSEGVVDALRRDRPELVPAVQDALAALRERGLLEESNVSEIPERLGGFRLVRELGMGGMGVVYLAEQEDLGRRVALKLIRPEHLYFPASRERFRREIEAVARLQHVGIAQIHTVGEERGLPFFTMEFVDGLSMAELIQRLGSRAPNEIGGAELLQLMRGGEYETDAGTSSTTSSRSRFNRQWTEVAVDLAVQIGEALQHAHERGVLHRDVKPSNVLLTADGRACLVDFGLARIETDQRMTATASEIGSLPYLPPEHLDGAAPIPSVVQDVYSLGVTLYEMLGLHSAFQQSTAEATRAAIRAGRPAVALRSLNPSARADLVTVCMTAMSPDPVARYRTMAEFVQDLDNVRSRRPISARPPTVWVRARRWLQRHPSATTSILVGVVALALAAMVLVGFERSARREADRLTAAAEQRATEADAVTEFMVELFRYASPDRSIGADIPVSMLLQQGAERIEHELSGQPETLARLNGTFARVYSWLGETEKAVRFYDEAMRLRHQLVGDEDSELLRLKIGAATMQRQLGDYDAAGELLDQVERILPRIDDSERAPILIALCATRGVLLHTCGDVTGAERMVRRALAEARSRPDDLRGLCQATAGLGRFLAGVRRHEAANELLLESLALHRRAYPEGHPAMASAMESAASALARLRRFDQAEPLIRQALAERERMFGASHPRTVFMLRKAVTIYRESGDFDRAIDVADTLLARVRGLPRVSGNFVARMLNEVVITYHQAGRYRDAEKLAEEALAASRTQFDGDHVLTAVLLSNLASAESQLGRHRDALQHGQQGVEMLRRVGDESGGLAEQLNSFASVCVSAGSADEIRRARDLVEEAIQIATVPPEQPWELGRAHALKACISNLSGDGSEAQRSAELAVDNYRRVVSGDHPYTALALYNLAWSLLTQGRGLAEAESHFLASIEMFERLGRGEADMAFSLNHYGFELQRERPAEAVPLLERALEIRRRLLPRSARWRLVSQVNLANAYVRLRRFDAAEPLLLEVHEVLTETAAEDSPELAASVGRLRRLYDRWGKPDKAAQYPVRK